MSTSRRRKRTRVAVVTGTRAEYGVLQSPMRAIRDHPDLQLQLAVTGMHLLPRFGRTIDEIAGDGWHIDARIPMQTGRDEPADQAAGLGRGVTGLARFFERAATEIVLVLGDRIEAMAGALAAVTTGRILAHIHGGDVALGDFDESLRHAITKLAHLHFAATRRSARRIIRMGEPPERVHVVGAPGFDRAREILRQMPRHQARGDYALVLQHAHGRSAATEQRVMRMILRAVAEAGLRRVIIYPNSDRGCAGVIRAIEQHARASAAGQVRTFRSLPRDAYLRVLCGAAVLIGNSSSGVIESSFMGTPAVDVGTRQAGREPGGRALVHADETAASIRAALRRALSQRPRRGGRCVYGDGRAGERIAEILAATQPTPDLLRKPITY